MKDSKELDRHLSYYDSTAAEYDEALGRLPGDRWVREAFHDLVTQSVPHGGLLLDFGCGTGTDAIWYARHGHRVLAYDYSRGMMQRSCGASALGKLIVGRSSPMRAAGRLS